MYIVVIYVRRIFIVVDKRQENDYDDSRRSFHEAYCPLLLPKIDV